MKPSPPDSLLLRNQAWIVVEAPWGVLTGSLQNQFLCSGYRCNQVGVIFCLDETKFFTEALCVEHMGSHRWIEDGKVMQWKADPPYINTLKQRVRIEKPGRN